jgi:MscS family membrane protein
LVYGTTPDKMELAMDILNNLPKTVKELEKIQVYFSGYGDSALGITSFYFIKKSADILETQSKINLEILKQFNANKLDFAYPTRTVIVQK